MTSFMTLTKCAAISAGGQGGCRAHYSAELDLQSNAFADSLPTQILNKYVEGGRHCQRQNIDRAYVKERRRPALYVYGAVHRIIYISKRILYMISFYHYKHQQYVLYYHSAFRLLDMMDRLLKFHQFLYQF